MKYNNINSCPNKLTFYLFSNDIFWLLPIMNTPNTSNENRQLILIF